MQEELCKKYEEQLSRVNILTRTNISIDLIRIHEEQHIRSLDQEGSANTSEDSISGYRDILCKDGRLCQKVALLGNIGHGKTLKCHRLIHDWISAVRKVKSNQHHCLSEDEQFLSEFSLIFYIRLEHAVEDCSAFEMICKQIFGYPVDSFPHIQPQKHGTLLEVFVREPKQCLIILDSLDKWKSTKSRKGLHNDYLPIQECTGKCPTVITSRHCKFNAIRHTLVPSDFDSIFEVCRLKNEKQAAENLIKIFSEADETAHEKVAYEEIHNFLHQSAIQGLGNIPAIMHYIIWAMFSCQSLQESQTEMVNRIVVHLFECGNIVDSTGMKASTGNTGDQVPQKNYCHPDVFGCSDVMDRNKVLVSKLARAAFHDMFFSGDQSPLILTELEVKNYFGKEELAEALKSGILIQKKVIGSTLLRRMQLSFLCESLQHFFAALHVAGSIGPEQKDLVDKLLDFCAVEDRIYRVENFLLFVLCMVPDLCTILSQSYFEKKLTGLTDFDSLDRFKHLLKKILKELDIFHRKSTKQYLFYMDAIKLSMSDFSRNDESLSSKLFRDNIGNLKQLIAIADESDTFIHTDEQLTRISSYILKHLASASCLVKLHLVNIVLVDGGSILSSLKTLEELHLENVRNTEKTVLNLTNCTGLKELKCSLLKNMELTISSAVPEIVRFCNCTSVKLTMQQVSDWYTYLLEVNMWFFTNDERRKLKSVDCADLKFCEIDFLDISMNMDALYMNGCSDCKFTFGHATSEDDDPVSPKDSSLSLLFNSLPDLPDFRKIWSNPGEIRVSNINNVIVKNCKRLNLSAYGIVSSCVVENCTDIEVLFQSSEAGRDVFTENLEEVTQPFNLKVVKVENVRTDDVGTEYKRNYIKFLRMPICLDKMMISNCVECDILVDCFDPDDSLAKAESYFIKCLPQLDSCPQNNREVHMNQIKNCDIRLKTTNIALNVVNIEDCQLVNITFQQISPNTFLLRNPGHIPSIEPIIHKLICSQLSDCRLNGLEGAVVKNIMFQSCELAWDELGLKDMQSLHMESLPDSALEIYQSLRGCQSIRNLVSRHMSSRMMSSLEGVVASLPNLMSVHISDERENVAALVHSLTVCQIDSMKFDHVNGTIMSELVRYKNLKHLCLNLSDSCCFAIVMDTLPKLKHLVELEFTDCFGDALKALGNFRKELKSVEQFRLSHCQGSNDAATALQCVSAMPTLKKLTLDEVPGEMLLALQKYRMKNLEIFEFGPVIDEITPHHLCFLLSQPKLQKIICHGLQSSAFGNVIGTVFKMKTRVSVQMNKMGHLIEEILSFVKDVQQVDGLIYQDLQSDSVATVLHNLPPTVKFLCLGGASCAECSNPTQSNSVPQITKVNEIKANYLNMKNKKGVMQFTWNIDTLELFDISLNSHVIQCIENLKTVRELKLNSIKDFDVELLGRCVGNLSVEVLTLSDILFKESALNLSNAYRLTIITLYRIYMHTRSWICFFEKLPKLMDVLESAIVTLSDCKTRQNACAKVDNKHELPLVEYSRVGKSNSDEEGRSVYSEGTADLRHENTVYSSGGNKKERCYVSSINDDTCENISVIYSRTNRETEAGKGDSKTGKKFSESGNVKTLTEYISDVDIGTEITNTETKDNVARSSKSTVEAGNSVTGEQEAFAREPECVAQRFRDMSPHEIAATKAAVTEKEERLSIESEFVLVDKVERKHSTCIEKIVLSEVCIRQEAISAISNLGLFSKEGWSCIRIADPAVYNGTLSLEGKH